MDNSPAALIEQRGYFFMAYVITLLESSLTPIVIGLICFRN